MLNRLLDPLRRFLEKRHMKTELRRLRASGELEQILCDSNYKVLYGDQGSDFVDVYRKGNEARGSELFSALVVDKDEAIWWIVQRHREETEGRTG